MAARRMRRAFRRAPRGLAIVGATAAAFLGLLPTGLVLGHAVGKPFQSPIPLWMQLGAAGLAVAASFAVSVAIVKVGADPPRYPRLRIPLLPSLAVRWLLAAVGLLGWY